MRWNLIGIFTLGALLLCLPAFAQDREYSEAEQANMDTVGAMFEAFESGDMDGILARLADDVVWELNGSPEINPLLGIWNGHEGVLAWFEKFDSLVEVIEFSTEEMWVDGDVVFVLNHNKGKVKSTGVVVDQREMMLFWVADGKVTRMLDFEDSGQTFLALHPEARDMGSEDRD